MEAQTNSSQFFPGLAWLVLEIKKFFCSLGNKLCCAGEVKRESSRREDNKDKEKEDSFHQRRGKRKWRQLGGESKKKLNYVKETRRENCK